MSYILATALACVHVDDVDLLATCEKLRNGANGTESHPLAIWQVFAVGAPRPLVAIPGLVLPDPLPPIVRMAGDAAPAPAAAPPSAPPAETASTEPAPPSAPAAPANDDGDEGNGYIDAEFEERAPASAPAPIVAPVPEGEIDPVAKARIDAQQAALRAAGVKGIGWKGEGGDGDQFFANGTRMMAVGYTTQAARKADYDAQIDLRDAANELAACVRAEKRHSGRSRDGKIESGGGLLAITVRDDGTVEVEVYRADPNVRVRVGP